MTVSCEVLLGSRVKIIVNIIGLVVNRVCECMKMAKASAKALTIRPGPEVILDLLSSRRYFLSQPTIAQASIRPAVHFGGA